LGQAVDQPPQRRRHRLALRGQWRRGLAAAELDQVRALGAGEAQRLRERPPRAPSRARAARC
jgi:hypothetical protein